MTPSIFCLPVDCIFLIGTITESLIISCALIVTHVKSKRKKVNTILLLMDFISVLFIGIILICICRKKGLILLFLNLLIAARLILANIHFKNQQLN